MRLMIIDTETTGLDPKTSDLIEVAGVVYDTDEAAILSCFSTLVALDKCSTNAVAHINGISDALLKGEFAPEHALVKGAPERDWSQSLFDGEWADRGCEYLLAHNAPFDRSFLPECADLPWLDSHVSDLWPRMVDMAQVGGSLAKLAAAYGVTNVAAHRAVGDCLTLAACLTLEAKGDPSLGIVPDGGLKRWLAAATEPRVTLRSQHDACNNELAKDLGFKRRDGEPAWTFKGATAARRASIEAATAGWATISVVPS